MRIITSNVHWFAVTKTECKTTSYNKATANMFLFFELFMSSS